MKRKTLYGVFCLSLTLSFSGCLSPSPSTDGGKAPQPNNALSQPANALSQQTGILLREAGFDLEYVGSSIKIENFENGKNGWHFTEGSSAGSSDLYPSTGGISEKELDDYSKAIEAGTLPALSELEDPEAYLKELLTNFSDTSGWETGDLALTFTDKDGTPYQLSDRFLTMPESNSPQ